MEDRTLLNAGLLDPTFGAGGLVSTPYTSGARNSFAVQSDGKIVVAGVSNGATNQFSVARFTPDGSLDKTFGVSGFATVHFTPTSNDVAKGLALQTDGKIVVAGDSNAGAGGENFGVTRLNADGTIDNLFGTNGRVIIDFYGANDRLSAVAIQSNGRIVVAGLSDTHFALARMMPDGMQDSDFDADGKVDFDFAAAITNGKVTGSTDGINGMAIQPDGQIVVAGFTNLASNLKALTPNTTNFALARFNAIDGTLDRGFGVNGLVDTDFFASPTSGDLDGGNDTANTLMIMPDGRIAAAGWTDYNGGGQNFALAIYTHGGKLDNSYNADGLVSTDFSTNFTSGSLGQPPVNDIAYGIGLQPDGKFVLAGSTTRTGNSNFAISRYNTDGTLDQNFSLHGEVVTAFTPSSQDAITNLVIQADGKILVGGTSDTGGGPTFALARYAGLQAGNLQFSASAFTVAESGGTATITVTRTNGSDGTVSVNYATGGGTAVAGTDYTATSGTLTFAPGETTQTFTVPVQDDGIFQTTDKTVNVTLSSPTGGSLLSISSSAVLTITESDGPQGVQFSAAAYSVAENGGTATIMVTRSGGSGTVTVNYATSNGTASAGTNYTATSGTLTFTPGQLSQTFTVSVQDDGVFQLANTTVNLTLTNASGGVLGSQTTAVLTILERDGTPNQRFVAQAYLDLLQRQVDPAGLNSWVAVLNSGGTRQQVAAGIENTGEYRAVVVQGLYNQYLHRSADTSGLNGFTTFLAAGGTIEQAAALIVSSAEYFQNRGGGTNDGFLTALFQDALNRGVDPAGRAAFDAQLAAGTSRAQVASTIFASTEYLQDLVQSFYQHFLGRPADSLGLSTFVALLQPVSGSQQPIFVSDPSARTHALTDQDVIAILVGSQEYFSRVS